MTKFVIYCGLLLSLGSCNNNGTKLKAASTTEPSDKPAAQATNLPYTPLYTVQWSDNVSDADLKTVLDSYKYWETNNISGLSATMGDSVEVDMSNGTHFKKTNAELMKMWSAYRDSLSSVTIKMDSWHKMYATDKKDAYIVTWYDEIDTFKDGRVDSASYHDINQLKNGKIIWYSQYKRPKK